MRFLFCAILLLTTSSLLALTKADNPKDALRELMAGNQRFVNEKTTCPDRNQIRRLETEQQQFPFAAILGCSDSRASPEIIFDAGLGDLFIVRVAGNIASAIELDSLEYALLHLHASLIMVLGHANCGAVGAVLDGQVSDIENVANLIEQSFGKNQPLDLESAIKANVRNVVSKLRATEVISRLIAEKKVDVVGGYYNFTTGQVELLQ